MATVAAKPITVEEFEQMVFDHPVDLVEGEIIAMPPAGSQHGRVAINVGFLLESWCRQQARGIVLGNDAAIVIGTDPDTVRGADVSFISQNRIPAEGLPEGALRIAPDLVVEVLSPSDRWADVFEKVTEYLAIGVKEVWVVDGTKKLVDVFRPGSSSKRFANSDQLTSPDVLPGFATAVSEFFRNV